MLNGLAAGEQYLGSPLPVCACLSHTVLHGAREGINFYLSWYQKVVTCFAGNLSGWWDE